MKKTIKKYLPLISFICILTALICSVFYYYSTGQPKPTSVEQVKIALQAQELNFEDATETAFDNFPNAGLKSCLIAVKDDIRFEFYTFDNNGSAIEVYRQAHTIITTTRLENPRVEISNGKMNYRFYSLDAGDMYSVATYVGNTAIYAYCDTGNQTKINSILDDIGYVDAVSEREYPSWVLSVSRLFQFVLYIVLALVARRWLWLAACQSAEIAQKRKKFNITKKETAKWLVEISPRKIVTKTILYFYKIAVLPEYICVILAFIGCFTAQLDTLLNLLGVIIPLIIAVTALIGGILKRAYSARF